MKTITVTRNRGWYGRFRMARVLVDDLELGLVGAGKSVQVRIPDRAVHLFAMMDWGRSLPFPVTELQDGQTIYMNCWFTLNLLKGVGVFSIPIALERSPR